MPITITKTTPIYWKRNRQGVFVQWNVSGVVAPATVSVWRGFGPNGPFEELISNVTDFHYVDDHPNLLSLHRTVYYRCVLTEDGQEPVSDTVVVGDYLDRRNMLLRRKLQRDIAVGFKFNAVDVAILKQKNWGPRCSVCYDTTTKETTASKCEECFGTSFENGYATPYYTRARVGVRNVSTALTTHGDVDTNTTRMWMLTEPMLEKDDVVVHLRQNARYIVNKAYSTELQGVPVHQNLVLSELTRDSIQYAIPVDRVNIPQFF